MIPEVDVLNEYLAFVEELKAHFINGKPKDEFSYQPSDIASLYEDTYKKRGFYSAQHRYISAFDIERIAEMLLISSPAEIDKFRGILLSLYRDGQIRNYDECDIIALRRLKNIVDENVRDNTIRGKIKLQQMTWLSANIDDFLENI